MGICSTVKSAILNPKTFTIDGPIVTYAGYGHRAEPCGVTGNVMAGTATAHIQTGLAENKCRIELAKLQQIWISDFDHRSLYGSCKRLLPGKLVTLFADTGALGFDGTEFHVTTEGLQTLLVVLVRHSPNVELRGKLLD